MTYDNWKTTEPDDLLLPERCVICGRKLIRELGDTCSPDNCLNDQPEEPE